MQRWLGIQAAIVVLILCAVSRGQEASPRHVIDLDANWLFARIDATDGANPSLEDSSWLKVSLPHTWNNLDGEDGGNNYYRGPAWYRLHLNLESEAQSLAGKRMYLRFGAASIAAEVFVNGKKVGEHKGAFAGFVFDVTDELKMAGDNVIAVRVTNAHDVNIPPLSGDFTMFGGLYRRVSLLAVGPLSISPVDEGGPGIYLRQDIVTAQRAMVHVTARLRNASDAQKNATVIYQVLDAAGKTILSAQEDQTVGPNSSADAIENLSMVNPHLWNGRADPYLYTLVVTVKDGDAVVDRVDQPMGLRSFRVDPERGFILNGAVYPVHGVNRHQDHLDKGWAISAEDQKQDFNLIMEMGCTGIRLSHYQHAQEFYDLCDRGGLVVWAEACMVNSVTASEAFDDAAKQQLRELIKQNFNHPSIFFWSVFNELGPGKNKPDDVAKNPQVAHQVQLVTELVHLAHELDPTRLTTAATSLLDADAPVNRITDVLGYNAYYGWYYGNADDLASHIDHIHAQRPDFAIGISEYGAGGSAFQHEADVTQPKTKSHWHPEEWECLVHETAWRTMKQRPWLWGTFLWNMFDFAVDNRDEGDHAGRNDKGMITYDRKTKKDVFFFYKANWSSDPFVYITDRRFTPRNVSDGPVKIYSNCDSVELRVNGQSQGSQKGDDVHIFRWKNVDLKEGENQLEAVGTLGGKQYRDACEIVVDAKAPTSQSAGPN